MRPLAWFFGVSLALVLLGMYVRYAPRPSIASSSHPTGRLIRAVNSGDVALAKKALVDGADPNCMYRQIPDAFDTESTPLIDGATRGDTAMVILLLNAGADPSRTAAWGVSPLAAAKRQRHRQVVALLQERPFAHEQTLIRAPNRPRSDGLGTGAH